MDFLAAPPADTPKRAYQCLAAISVDSQSRRGSRRGSVGSTASDGNGLTRILSGGRRKSLNGDSEGTWFWRCRAGVTAVSVQVG